MTGVCVGLKPKDIEDITAIIALYRPGPMDSIPGSSPPSTTPRSPTSTPPRADPLRHLRLHRVPGAGHRDLPPPGGWLFPGPGRHGPPGHVQEEAGDIQREREAFLHGDPEPKDPGSRSQRHPQATADSFMTRSRLSPTTPSTKPTPSAMPLWPIRRPGLSATTPGVYGRPADLGAGQLRQGGRVYRRVQRTGHRRLPPDVNQLL